MNLPFFQLQQYYLSDGHHLRTMHQFQKALSDTQGIFSEEFTCEKLPIVREVLKSKRAMGNDCNDNSLISLGFSKPNGSYALAYWKSTDVMHKTFESTVSFAVSRLPEAVHLVDPMTGIIYNLPEEILENLGDGHLKLKNIPVLDYPLFLTFGEFI